MNDSSKLKISELRKLGYGYKKIAKELSMTVSAVRCVCDSIKEEDILVRSCQNCGLKIKSIQGKKKKKFCSDKCRWEWWNSHLKEVNKKSYYTKTCKYCEREFSVYGNNKRVYCAHDCYIKDKSKKGRSNDGTK